MSPDVPSIVCICQAHLRQDPRWVTSQDTLQLGTLTPSLQHALRNYWWSHREGEKRGLYQDPILHRHSQHHWQRPAPGLQACSELLLCLALSQHDSTQTIQHTESVGDEQ